MQPHTQLLCATQLARGIIRVATAAGATVGVLYDSSELLQPPIVGSVTPPVWSPSEPTTVVISGERWGPWGSQPLLTFAQKLLKEGDTRLMAL